MLTLRAKFILACAAGAPNSEVVQRFDITNAAVGKWLALQPHSLYSQAASKMGGLPFVGLPPT